MTKRPLASAASKGNCEEIRALLDEGHYIDEQDADIGWTALMFAIHEDHTEAAVLLLDSGARVDVKSKSAWRAVTLAVEDRRTEIVEAMIERGIDVVNEVNHMGQTSLIVAVESRNAGMVKVLMEAGADPFRKDNYGKTALDYARELNQQEIMRILLLNEEVQK